MGVQTLDFRSLLHCYGTRPLLHWKIGQSARGALGAAPRIRDGLEGLWFCNWLTHPLLPPCFCTAITDQLIYQRPNNTGASAHNLLRLVDHLSKREDPQLATVQPDGDRITLTQSKDTAKLHGNDHAPTAIHLGHYLLHIAPVFTYYGTAIPACNARVSAPALTPPAQRTDPRDSMANMFDPFFTARDAGRTTGLGLSLAYDVVPEHGRHSEVNVTLPARPGRTRQ